MTDKPRGKNRLTRWLDNYLSGLSEKRKKVIIVSALIIFAVGDTYAVYRILHKGSLETTTNKTLIEDRYGDE